MTGDAGHQGIMKDIDTDLVIGADQLPGGRDAAELLARRGHGGKEQSGGEDGT